MIVAYADGAGLGHLTRLQAARHTLGLDGPMTVLTSSAHAFDARLVGDLDVVTIPFSRRCGAERRSWVADALARVTPAAFVVDAFPAGLAGELDADSVPPGTATIHLARLLRWAAYAPLLPDRPMRFDTTYVLEPLAPRHRLHVDAHSDAVVDLELSDPPTRSPGPTWDDVDTHAGSPRWLVVHTGPAAEVVELVAYAREQAAMEGVQPVLVAVTPDGAALDVVTVDAYPATSLIAGADRVFTAAGFNAMRQLAPHRDRHRFLAMPRRFDDQVERARRARAG